MNRCLTSARETPAASGFTLLEILVAVAVFAIVLVAIQSVFHGALRLRTRVVTNLDASVPVEQAMTIIRRDLANLTAAGGTLGAGLVDTATTVSTNSSGTYGTEFYTTSGRLDANEPWGEIQRVSYQLMEATNRTATGRDLYRSVTRNLLPAFEEEPESEWLMSGVDEFRVEFFDGYEWLQLWDTTTTNTLPKALRVEIVLAKDLNDNNRAERAPIELVVPLDIQPRSAQSTNASDAAGTGGGGS